VYRHTFVHGSTNRTDENENDSKVDRQTNLVRANHIWNDIHKVRLRRQIN